jgi:putative ABC transport system permease protein
MDPATMRQLKTVGSVTLAIAAVVGLAILPWFILATAAMALLSWMIFTRTGHQALLVTQVGLSTISLRLGSSLVIVFGIAGVVGVLIALLAMSAGFEAALKQSGTDDTAIITRIGARGELDSNLTGEDVAQIESLDGISHDGEGNPLMSRELVEVVALPRRSNLNDANVLFRGIDSSAWQIHRRVAVTDGRKFDPGRREIVVGRAAHVQFSGLDIGAAVAIDGQPWKVVGIFDSGEANDSEIWTDRTTMASAYQLGTEISSLQVKLADSGAVNILKKASARFPRLRVEISTTRAYYAMQSEGLTSVIKVVGTTIAAIMGIGALFGALNTMYSAVSARSSQIATMRAIGFRGQTVLVSVMLEAILLAIIGGLLGGAMAWALFNHHTVSTLSANFTQVMFSFVVSGTLFWLGLKWAIAVGFLGGLFPALRASRVSVVAALREK